jgi:hypothetical protein
MTCCTPATDVELQAAGSAPPVTATGRSRARGPDRLMPDANDLAAAGHTTGTVKHAGGNVAFAWGAPREHSKPARTASGSIVQHLPLLHRGPSDVVCGTGLATQDRMMPLATSETGHSPGPYFRPEDDDSWRRTSRIAVAISPNCRPVALRRTRGRTSRICSPDAAEHAGAVLDGSLVILRRDRVRRTSSAIAGRGYRGSSGGLARTSRVR